MKIADYEKRQNSHLLALEGNPIPELPHTPKAAGNRHYVPFSLVSLAIVHGAGFTFTDKLLEAKKKLQQKEIPDVPMPDFLMPFQAEGVRRLCAKSKGALLADEQGLGKTVQLLTYIASKPELRPCVIVAPAHLKHVWVNEAAKFFPNMIIEKLVSQTPYPVTNDVLVINYEILQYWDAYLTEIGVKLVICDEAHRVKNRDAACTKAMLAIGKRPVRIMATGTPLVNSPENVWSLVDAIDSNILGSERSFNKYFTDSKQVPIYRHGRPMMIYGRRITRKVVTGFKHLDILHKTLASSVMIRRTKAQVLPQLPEKTRTVIPVDVGLAELNKQTIGDIKQAGGAVNASSCYAKLYSAVGEAKIPASIAWIEDYLQNTDQPLVVMGWHREVMIALHERFKDDSVLIIGGVTDKEQSIQKFMSGDKRILIGNIKAAGTGLTLTNASSMLFVELPMTPADLGQAMDRIHRIGQDTKCSYYFIVGKDTIEERIIRVLDRKASMANTVVDNVADEVQLGNLLLEAINGQ